MKLEISIYFAFLAQKIVKILASLTQESTSATVLTKWLRSKYGSSQILANEVLAKVP